MIVVCSAKVGMLPGYDNKGVFQKQFTVETTAEAVYVHKCFIEDLEDKYDDDFVTDLGYDIKD